MKHRLAAGLVLLGLCLAASPALAEYFTITSFRSDIRVRRDSSFMVRETIETVFTSQRHGLYRDLPFRYTDDLGKKLRTPLTVLAVTDEQGHPWPYRVLLQGDARRVRIGDPHRFVEGRQVYVITYRVANAILFLGDRDELYWNVTGNGWEVPMERVTATATVEGSGPLDLKARCYTGTYGSREEACDFTPAERGGTFKTAHALNPGEGFTVALGWDKGAVLPPSALTRFWWDLNAGENWVFLLPLFSLVFMYRHWRKRGKDPEVGDTVAVMFTPPEAAGRLLLAAEVGALADGKLDPRDLTASIVQLAVKGCVTIEEVKTDGLIFDHTDHRLTRIGKSEEGISLFERELLTQLFGASSSILVSELKYKFYASVSGLKKTVFGNLKELGYYQSTPENVKAAYIGIGVAVALVGALVAALMHEYLGMETMNLVVVVLLSVAPVLAFAPIMPARTRRGALAWLKVKGFEEFLSRAEKDRLERMADKNLFEKYLPFAIALDVSERWAKAFEGIYQDPPRWYASPHGMATFQPVSFNRSLGGALSSMGTALYAAPRSSGGGGSGGGGFSGGGFGGGGGGSW